MTTFQTEHGDRTALDNEVLRVEVGSRLLGLGVGSDDQDMLGVYVESDVDVLGTREPRAHYTARTQREGGRSGPGDIDLTLYPLRRYLRLAVQGNPSVLLLLYAPASALLTRTTLGEELREHRSLIVSRQAGHRFLGYLHAQRERMLGRDKRARVPKRPELIERYGFDTKYAYQALRLGMQGVELLTTGTVSLPMRPEQREMLLAVRTGGIPFQECVSLIKAHEAQLQRALDAATPLSDEPDLDTIERWSVSAHLRHWSWNVR